MATFTIELYRLVESGTDIGLNSYPIFDEAYRNGLNQKIKDHFWNREIGFETTDEFRLHMRRKMNEIMPYYNQLYESTKIEINPLLTVSVTNTSESHNAQTAAAESSSTSDGTGASDGNSVVSNFPQIQLAGNADYASNGSFSKSTSSTNANSSDNSSSNSTDDNTGSSSSQGYTGSPSALLQEYRATMLNIDLMIINELEDLFMLVWNTSDDYTSVKGWY